MVASTFKKSANTNEGAMLTLSDLLTLANNPSAANLATRSQVTEIDLSQQGFTADIRPKWSRRLLKKPGQDTLRLMERLNAFPNLRTVTGLVHYLDDRTPERNSLIASIYSNAINNCASINEIILLGFSDDLVAGILAAVDQAQRNVETLCAAIDCAVTVGWLKTNTSIKKIIFTDPKIPALQFIYIKNICGVIAANSRLPLEHLDLKNLTLTAESSEHMEKFASERNMTASFCNDDHGIHYRYNGKFVVMSELRVHGQPGIIGEVDRINNPGWLVVKDERPVLKVELVVGAVICPAYLRSSALADALYQFPHSIPMDRSKFQSVFSGMVPEDARPLAAHYVRSCSYTTFQEIRGEVITKVINVPEYISSYSMGLHGVLSDAQTGFLIPPLADIVVSYCLSATAQAEDKQVAVISGFSAQNSTARIAQRTNSISSLGLRHNCAEDGEVGGDEEIEEKELTPRSISSPPLQRRSMSR